MEWKLTKEAEEAKKQVQENNESDHSFGGSDGFWYDITDGGYFKAEKALSDIDQIAEVNKAVNLLRDLEENVYTKIVPEF